MAVEVPALGARGSTIELANCVPGAVMATEILLVARGGVGGLGEAGGEADDPAVATGEVCLSGRLHATSVGIDDAKFSLQDFLAALDSRGRRRDRRQGRHLSWLVGAVLQGMSDTVAGGAQVEQSESTLVRAATVMPLTRKNGNWSDKNLYNAMNVMIDDGMPLREAGRLFGVPTTSLRDHLYGKIRGRHRGIKPTLNSHIEKKLVDYVFKMQELDHPLTSTQLHRSNTREIYTLEWIWGP